MGITVKPGVYRGVPEEEYFSWDAVSRTQLIRFDKCPVLSLLSSDIDAITSNIGKALHLIAFQPERAEEVVLQPSFTGSGARTKRAEFLEENKDNIVLTSASYELVIGMTESLLKHQESRELLSKHTDTELSLVGNSGKLLKKARLDSYNSITGTVVDLKTTTDASIEGFSKASVNYGYFAQAAWYLNLLKLNRLPAQSFFFVCVEKTPPYLCATYFVPRDVIELENKRLQKIEAAFLRAKAENKFPGYNNDEIALLDYPNWYRNKLEAELNPDNFQH